MTKYLDADADVSVIAHALGSPRRTAVVDELCRGPATTTRLAAVAGTSLPTMHQHLDVLRSAGLVRSAKRGRTMSHVLDPRPLERLDDWISTRRTFWSHQLDALANALEGPDGT